MQTEIRVTGTSVFTRVLLSVDEAVDCNLEEYRADVAVVPPTSLDIDLQRVCWICRISENADELKMFDVQMHTDRKRAM